MCVHGRGPWWPGWRAEGGEGREGGSGGGAGVGGGGGRHARAGLQHVPVLQGPQLCVHYHHCITRPMRRGWRLGLGLLMWPSQSMSPARGPCKPGACMLGLLVGTLNAPEACHPGACVSGHGRGAGDFSNHSVIFRAWGRVLAVMRGRPCQCGAAGQRARQGCQFQCLLVPTLSYRVCSRSAATCIAVAALQPAVRCPR